MEKVLNCNGIPNEVHPVEKSDAGAMIANKKGKIGQKIVIANKDHRKRVRAYLGLWCS